MGGGSKKATLAVRHNSPWERLNYLMIRFLSPTPRHIDIHDALNLTIHTTCSLSHATQHFRHESVIFMARLQCLRDPALSVSERMHGGSQEQPAQEQQWTLWSAAHGHQLLNCEFETTDVSGL